MPGAVEDLRVERQATEYLVRAAVRKTDVVGTVGNTEAKEVLATDLTGLRRCLPFKGLDRGATHHPRPRANTPTDEVVRGWMPSGRSGR